MRTRALVAATIAGALLAACSAVRVVNTVSARFVNTSQRDLVYGSDPRQRLDVYQPAPTERLAPVVVFFYGGSWQSGDRRNYRFVGEALSSAGFVTVIADYRLYPSVRFPAFIEDGAQAVRWTAEHARDYGGDPERIFLMGHSAGAHIAALLTLDERYLEKAGAPEGVIRATVGLAGPYQFRYVSRAIQAVFDGSVDWSTTQPIHFVGGDEPPMLLLSGAADDVVDPRSASRLAARIRKKGGWVRHVVYPGLGHVGIVTALAMGFQGRAPVIRDSVNFFRLHGADETTAPWPPPPKILSANAEAAD